MRNHIVALWAAVVILAGAALFAVVQGINSGNAVQREQAVQNTILCDSQSLNQHILQKDREAVKQGVKFLQQHPNGTPDFSAAFIRDSIAKSREFVKFDQARVRNLSKLNCP
jgi:hypothetical protein